MDFNRFTRVSLDLNLVDIVTRVFTGFHGSDGFYRVILLIIFYRVLPSFPRSEMVINNNNNNNNKTKDTHTKKKWVGRRRSERPPFASGRKPSPASPPPLFVFIFTAPLVFYRVFMIVLLFCFVSLRLSFLTKFYQVQLSFTGFYLVLHCGADEFLGFIGLPDAETGFVVRSSGWWNKSLFCRFGNESSRTWRSGCWWASRPASTPRRACCPS